MKQRKELLSWFIVIGAAVSSVPWARFGGNGQCRERGVCLRSGGEDKQRDIP